MPLRAYVLLALTTFVVGAITTGASSFTPSVGLTPVVGPQLPDARVFLVSAKRFRFEPARIEVNQDDVVRIELRSEDIPHSLTIDAYRIAKRANPGRPVAFEFRADRAGTFPYYCNLQIDDGCRQMKGTLVVKRRR